MEKQVPAACGVNVGLSAPTHEASARESERHRPSSHQQWRGDTPQILTCPLQSYEGHPRRLGLLLRRRTHGLEGIASVVSRHRCCRVEGCRVALKVYVRKSRIGGERVDLQERVNSTFDGGDSLFGR